MALIHGPLGSVVYGVEHAFTDPKTGLIASSRPVVDPLLHAGSGLLSSMEPYPKGSSPLSTIDPRTRTGQMTYAALLLSTLMEGAGGRAMLGRVGGFNDAELNAAARQLSRESRTVPGAAPGTPTAAQQHFLDMIHASSRIHPDAPLQTSGGFPHYGENFPLGVGSLAKAIGSPSFAAVRLGQNTSDYIGAENPMRNLTPVARERGMPAAYSNRYLGNPQNPVTPFPLGDDALTRILMQGATTRRN